MKHQLFALSAIRKNGFLVYKNESGSDMTIRKRSDYPNDESFFKAVITFPTEQAAEDFIKDNHLVSVEAVAISKAS